MSASPARRALLQYTLVATPLAVLVFLIASKFFSSWDGHAVSVFPAADGAATYRVLVDERDATRVIGWPAPLVKRLELPFDNSGVAPVKLPETAPHTSKSRFSLYFLVEAAEGEHEIVPTTSPYALTLAIILWIVGLFVRNMAMGGSPFELVPGPTVLPAPLPPAGQPTQPGAARPKKGPPPSRQKRRRR